MKATEPAWLLPLLVPALSEAEGWQGLGARCREQEQAGPLVREGFLEEELMSLNFSRILE